MKNVIATGQNNTDTLKNYGVLGRLLEEESLPEESISDFINLLFAGNETTAKTMLFVVYFLNQCPEALQQLIVCSQIYNLSL